ncbi:hypothetical protein MMAGJ_11730 [Mycolicibacterium mageritense]|uniref:DUF222 domain-containing protein n=1 Tax=Mycolicibacterium mageritense TaxID=53462 RepID=A0ABN5Y3E2_MYCME|nr:hypothetical protein MMAGJ_11730 [Mycolicibacterium mageritense]
MDLRDEELRIADVAAQLGGLLAHGTTPSRVAAADRLALDPRQSRGHLANLLPQRSQQNPRLRTVGICHVAHLVIGVLTLPTERIIGCQKADG